MWSAIHRGHTGSEPESPVTACLKREALCFYLIGVLLKWSTGFFEAVGQKSYFGEKMLSICHIVILILK